MSEEEKHAAWDQMLEDSRKRLDDIFKKQQEARIESRKRAEETMRFLRGQE